MRAPALLAPTISRRARACMIREQPTANESLGVSASID
jgi:hypothetical protein